MSEALVRLRVAELDRRKQTFRPRIEAGIERAPDCLSVEERAVETAMDALLAADPELSRQARFPGIGPGNVRIPPGLGVLPEPGQASAKELAALAEIFPISYGSGRRRDQGAIGGGRAVARGDALMLLRRPARGSWSGFSTPCGTPAPPGDPVDLNEARSETWLLIPLGVNCQEINRFEPHRRGSRMRRRSTPLHTSRKRP